MGPATEKAGTMGVRDMGFCQLIRGILARNLGFDTSGSDSGNAKALATQIISCINIFTIGLIGRS